MILQELSQVNCSALSQVYWSPLKVVPGDQIANTKSSYCSKVIDCMTLQKHMIYTTALDDTEIIMVNLKIVLTTQVTTS